MTFKSDNESLKSTSVVIRPATESDNQTIARLARYAHKESRGAGRTFDPDRYAELRRIVLANRQNMIVLVAEHEGKLLGFLRGQVGEFLFSRDVCATVITLFMRPEVRGGMTAARLLRSFAAWARNRGAIEVLVSVTSGVDIGRSDAFFQRLGLRQAGGNYALALDEVK